jgi:replicative DNA helicase
MTDTVHALPHAPGVEKDVVSVLMQYPEKLDEAPELTEAHFHHPPARIVFAMIRGLVSAGQPVELVSFVQRLSDRGQLDQAGGPSAVCDIHNHAATPQNFACHVAMLCDKLARRMTIAAAEEMTRAAFESDGAAEIIAATSAPITAIHDQLTGNKPATSTKAVLSECWNRFEARSRGIETPMGIETSLAEINTRFKGLHGKQTVVISAYPGGGKTTLAGQLAMDAATGGHNTLFCSLEMPAADLMNRMLAYVARLPGDAITDPRGHCQAKHGTAGPTGHLLNATKAAFKRIAGMPFLIEDLVGANVNQIAACIRRAHRKSPLAVVVVDYAQRIRSAPEKVRENREQQLSHASNLLADLSKELGFCLLLPSQLNKEGAAKHAEAINEDADLHLQIMQNRSGPNPDFNTLELP